MGSERIEDGVVVKTFKHKADATLAQSNPVSGTKYTVLATKKNVRILGIYVKCIWTVQPTPLELHVTIDGNAYTFSQTDPVSNTNYYAIYDFATAENSQPMGTQFQTVACAVPLFEGHSVKVEAEITGGTVSMLACRVRWEQKE